jgi:geranylgeranyl diphosphate synthase type II
MAILAGDALLTEAFSMLSGIEVQSSKFKVQSSEDLEQSVKPLIKDSKLRTPNPELLLRVIRDIAISAGACGMVGGQAQDILSENTKPDIDTLHFIHLHKTAALITASVRMGPILADSDEDTLEALTSYGKNIGLAFQIIDDILDVEGNTKELGKSSGSDKKKKKMTYPSLLGIEGSRQKAQDLISEAINILRIFSSNADPLREIARYLIKRRS